MVYNDRNAQSMILCGIRTRALGGPKTALNLSRMHCDHQLNADEEARALVILWCKISFKFDSICMQFLA